MLALSVVACSSDQRTPDGQFLEAVAERLRPAVLLVDEASAASGSAAPSSDQPAPATWELRERMEWYGAPGVVAVLARAGEVVEQAAWGTTIDGEELDPEQLLSLEEVTPVATTLAALRLVEQGTWDLTADLRSAKGVPPTVARLREPVTLTDLLRQSSGLRPEGPTGVSAEALSSEFRQDPAEGRHWSAVGESDWALLELLIESETDLAFADALQQLVLGPLGIEGARVGEDNEVSRVLDAAGQRVPINGQPDAARGLSVRAVDGLRLMVALCGSGADDGPASGSDEPLIGLRLQRQVARSAAGRRGLGVEVLRDGALLQRASRNVLLACHPESGDALLVWVNGGRGRELAQELLVSTALELGWSGVGPERLEEIPFPATAAQGLIGTYRFVDPAVEVVLSWTPERLLLEAPESALFPGEGAVRAPLIRVRGGLRRLDRPDRIQLDFGADAQWDLWINQYQGQRVEPGAGPQDGRSASRGDGETIAH